MAKILVTGGAGFLGSHVVKALLANGNTVAVLDDFSNGKRENVPHGPSIDMVQGDVADMATVRRAMQGCEHVVHLAVLSIPKSVENPQKSFSTNVAGTQAVLEVARELKLPGYLIYASSAAVYGDRDQPRVAEADAAGARVLSPYAAGKVAGETLAQVYRDLYGVRTLGLRLFNVYGPGQDAESAYSGLLTKVVDSIATGNLFPIFGDGKQTRDFVAVWDVAGVIAALLMRPVDAVTPPVMNLGSGQAVSVLDMIRQVVALKQVNPRVEYRTERPGEIRMSCADVALLMKVLPQWQPVTLQAGLRAWLR